MMEEGAGQNQLAPEVGFDPQEANLRVVSLVSLGILVSLVLTIILIDRYYNALFNLELRQKVQEPVITQMRDVRAYEERELHSYGYIDREKGIVRLPVERAMEVFLQEVSQGKLFYPAKPTRVDESTLGMSTQTQPAAQQASGP